VKSENTIDMILDDALDQCLAGATIEGVLSKYDPQVVAELEPLLEAASAFQSVKQPMPTGEALFKSLSSIGNHVEPARKSIPFPRLPMKVAASFIAIFSLMFGLDVAASNTVPGDTLYFVKKLSEKIQYMIMPTADGRIELKLTFSQKRMAELLKKSNSGELTDLDIVYEMLAEVDHSLNKVTQVKDISSEKKGVLISRVRDLNRRQTEVIKHVAMNCSGKLKAELQQVMETCNCREDWFGQLYSHENEMKSMGDCKPGSCCCAPSDEALSSKLVLFPKY